MSDTPASLRPRRWALLASVLAGLMVVAASPAVAAVPCLVPPVVGRVVDPFRAPACTWCAGNRGIEYATTPGAPVRAAADGSVSFVGVVAGIRYVVVDHGGGYRTTYGKLARSEVRTGMPVAAGRTVGIAGAETFFGLRLGDEYLDPAPHFARSVPQPRLVPLDGSQSRPAPPPQFRC
jgi:murein DD-endopeptidase MepM/ murein hydrolase activator NlpD